MLSIPSICTWTWEVILKGRTDASFMVRYLIGDRRDTGLWLDPWHHRGILRDHFLAQLTYNSEMNIKAKVRNLIQEGVGQLLERLQRYAPDIIGIIEDTK